jgi:hypothetical protein
LCNFDQMLYYQYVAWTMDHVKSDVFGKSSVQF